MKVLSLFDGLSGAQLALQKLGIPVGKYVASEVDPYAIKVTQANFPETIQAGDVQKYKVKEHFDLITFGSPCQGFSFAGKNLNFDDPRSKLFFEAVRILEEAKTINPNIKFLMENVRMKKESEHVISKYLGVEPIAINSNIFSAQNRYRLYWTNLNVGELPQDKGIVLKDILEDDFITDRDKAHCIDANYFKGGNLKSYFEKHRRQLVFSKDGLCHIGDADLKGHDAIKRVYHSEGKAPTVTTMGGGHREPKVFEEPKAWRKLTPLECERLQTVPDNYTNHVSNTQRYKMLGNGFNVDTIAFLLTDLK